MWKLIDKITFRSIQGLLVLCGFGALTAGFIKHYVNADLYVPIVTLMVGYFFAQAASRKD